MVKRTLAGTLIAGCTLLFLPAGQGAGATSDDPAAVPGARCSPVLTATGASARPESPLDVGGFIACLRASGYGTR